MDFRNKILHGDALEQLRTLPGNSVHCCVTSPPYFAKRLYPTDKKKQIGMEDTPELYIERIVQVCKEIKRVLRDDGTFWINIGDSYWGGKGKSGQASPEKQAKRNARRESLNKSYQQIGGYGLTRPTDLKHKIFKPKDMIGIPWRIAFALQEGSGWYFRSDIIWAKNAMPESVIDRPSISHEYLFMFSKSRKHYYFDKFGMGKKFKTTVWHVNTAMDNFEHTATFPQDLIKPIISASTPDHGCCAKCGKPYERILKPIGEYAKHCEDHVGKDGWSAKNKTGKSSIPWSLETGHYKAGWRGEKEEICIGWQKNCLCGTNEISRAIVLDPFFGSGTVGVVCKKMERDYVGIELVEKYVKMSTERIHETQHMALNLF